MRSRASTKLKPGSKKPKTWPKLDLQLKLKSDEKTPLVGPRSVDFVCLQGGHHHVGRTHHLALLQIVHGQTIAVAVHDFGHGAETSVVGPWTGTSKEAMPRRDMTT